MNQTIRRAVLLAAALSAPVSAQIGSEAFSAAGAARFQTAVLTTGGATFRPIGSAGIPKELEAEGIAAWDRDMAAATVLSAAVAFAPAAPGAVANLDMASLLNRHLRTRLHYTLNGRNVWFSGAFDLAQKPYVSVLVEGFVPRYYNVRDLLSQSQHLSFGGASYTLSLSPNYFHRMRSTISLTNDRNRAETASFSVQDMLDAVEAVGQPVALGPCEIFYTDGIGASGRLIVFIFGDSHDYHVFLVQESTIPTDRMAVYPMFNGLRVGLARRNGHLEVYRPH